LRMGDDKRAGIMKNQKDAANAADQPIDPCAATREQCGRWSKLSSEEVPSRCFLYFMTEREFEIHEELRRIKQEVSAIKQRLKQGTPPRTAGTTPQGSMESDRRRLAERLEELRKEWKRLDGERREAARERMRLLGHDPD